MNTLQTVLIFAVLIALADSTAQVLIRHFHTSSHGAFFATAVGLYALVAYLLYLSYKKDTRYFGTVNIFWVCMSTILIAIYSIVFFNETCKTKTLIAAALAITAAMIKASCIMDD